MVRQTLGILVVGFLLHEFSPATTPSARYDASTSPTAQVHAPRPGAAPMTCTVYPCPAGYDWYYFSDPECPDSPDSFEMWIEYWNSDGSFNNRQDTGGHSTYFCGTGYKGQTVTGTSRYQDCMANSPWNCQQLSP